MGNLLPYFFIPCQVYTNPATILQNKISMKNLLYLVPFIALGFFMYLEASATKTNSEEGIQFFQGTWEQALQKSVIEKKPIFLDIYATWCGPCKMLMGLTFPDKKVGEYFNEHFINVEIDGES